MPLPRSNIAGALAGAASMMALSAVVPGPASAQPYSAYPPGPPPPPPGYSGAPPPN
jgi:hypothetical protein